MIFESHAHYDDIKFDKDRYEVIDNLRNENIGKIINVAANMVSSVKCMELAKRYDFIYAAIGVHPHDVQDMKEEDLETLITFAAYDKVVGIGEIGLDYYYDNSPREVQKLWFREQMNLAKGLDLPVIIHSREAAKDTYDLITAADINKGVIHCYSGSKEMAKDYVDMGFYIGVGGIVTYNNAKTLKEVVKAIPLENLLLETDCPYLSPVPNRGKRNDSSNLVYIAEAIAKLKEIDVEEVIKVTYENGMKLFLS